MAIITTKTAIDTARDRIDSGRVSLDTIRKGADLATPELEKTAEELKSALDSALAAVDQIATDQHWWPTTRRFIRRLFSREVIIAVIAIISIWVGDLNAEQAIGVAVAAGGLVLGRSAVKVRTSATDS
jgi:hypothetical protein